MAARNDIALIDYAKAAKKRAAKSTSDASQLVGAVSQLLGLLGLCNNDPSLVTGVLLHGMSVLDTPETRELARLAGAQILEQLEDEIDKGLTLPQPKLMMAILETEPTEDLKRQLEHLELRPFATQSPLPHYVGWTTAAKLKPILGPVGGTIAPYKPPGGWLARAAIQTGADMPVGEGESLKISLGPSADDPSTGLIATEMARAPAKVIEALNDPQVNGMSSDDHTDDELPGAEAQTDPATSVTRYARSAGSPATDAPALVVTSSPPPKTRARGERTLPPAPASLAGSRARGVG